jgi:hypothetical protein
VRVMLDPKAVPQFGQLEDFASIRKVGETEEGTNLEPDQWK